MPNSSPALPRCLTVLLAVGLTACQAAPPTPVAVGPSPTASATPPAPHATFAVNLPFIAAEATATASPPTAPPASPAPAEPPTATPPPWPEPINGLAASKLGINVAMGTDPWLKEFINRVHPRVVTSPDDRGTIQYTAAVSPETIITSRVTTAHPGSEQWPDQFDPIEAANHYVNTSLPEYQKYPEVDYWEGWNEYIPQTEAHWHWYAQFEAARVCAMQAAGLRAAVGGFSVGWPNTYQQMEWFLPALEAAHRCGGILTLHEYNSPTFDCGTSVNTPDLIPGSPALNGLAGNRTLRYRILYEGLLKPRNLGDLPLIITELGIDAGAADGACDSPDRGAWKDHQAQWVQQNVGPSGPQAYVNLLAWYDQQIRQDAYVLGASIFTASGGDPAYGWYSFDLHDVFIPLAVYAVQQQ